MTTAKNAVLWNESGCTRQYQNNMMSKHFCLSFQKNAAAKGIFLERVTLGLHAEPGDKGLRRTAQVERLSSSWFELPSNVSQLGYSLQASVFYWGYTPTNLGVLESENREFGGIEQLVDAKIRGFAWKSLVLGGIGKHE